MICHICKAQATGQCKNCLKFYCEFHGDVLCVDCQSASAVAGSSAPTSGVEDSASASATPTEVVLSTGSTCYACKSPAVGACGMCARFCCGMHLAGTHPFDAAGRTICADCYSQKTTMTAIGCVIGVCIVGFMLLFILGTVAR